MKKILLLSVGITVCACFIWVVRANHLSVGTTRSNQTTSQFNDPDVVAAAVSAISSGMANSAKPLESGQQVGMKCVIYPRCPDCDGRGNVCSGAEEFFPGVTVIAKGRALMVTKCRKANALDYCGGSRGCMKKTREEQQRHRNSYGGGCYAQCQEKNVYCVLSNR